MPPSTVPPNWAAILPEINNRITFLEYQQEYQIQNANRARLFFTQYKTDFRQKISGKWTEKTQRKRWLQEDAPAPRHQWSQYEAMFQGYVSRHWTFDAKSLGEPQMRKLECSFGDTCSNSMFDQISKTIILVPDFSITSLEEIDYGIILRKLVAMNQQFWKERYNKEFRLSRIQYFWIYFTLIEVGYHDHGYSRRMMALDQAISYRAGQHWQTLATEFDYATDYEHPDESLLDLNNPSCLAAIFLPDIAHYTVAGKRGRVAFYTDFVPIWLSVNYPRTCLGKETADIVWKAYEEEQAKLWSLQHRDMFHDQPNFSTSKKLWAAIDAISEQTAELGLNPQSSDAAPWQRVDVLFKFSERNAFILPKAQPYGCTEPPFISFTNQVRVANPHIQWNQRSVENQWTQLGWATAELHNKAHTMAREPVVEEYWRNQALGTLKICHCRDNSTLREGGIDSETDEAIDSDHATDRIVHNVDHELTHLFSDDNDTQSQASSDLFFEDTLSNRDNNQRGTRSFTDDGTDVDAEYEGSNVHGAIMIADDSEGEEVTFNSYNISDDGVEEEAYEFFEEEGIAQFHDFDNGSPLFIEDDTVFSSELADIEPVDGLENEDETTFDRRSEASTLNLFGEDDEVDILGNDYGTKASTDDTTGVAIEAEKRSRSVSIAEDQRPAKRVHAGPTVAEVDRTTEKLRVHAKETMEILIEDTRNGFPSAERLAWYRTIHSMTTDFDIFHQE